MLAWTSVKALDELLDKLNTAYRQARILGGENPGDTVIADMWPPQASPCQQGATRPGVRVSVTVRPSPESASPVTAPPAQPDQTPAETQVEDRRADNQPPETDQQSPSEPVAPTPGTQCRSEESEDVPMPAEQSVDNLREDDTPTSNASPVNEPGSETTPAESDDTALRLRQTLRERHCPADEPPDYNPVSQKQLTQQLGWTRAQVQHAMKTIFGPRPFAVYRNRCNSKTIADILAEPARIPDTPQESRADDLARRARIAQMVSDQNLLEQITLSGRDNAEAVAKSTDNARDDTP
jgi:hypothetical protein